MDLYVWQRSCVDEAGNVLPEATVHVTDAVSEESAQLYSGEAEPIGNPVTTDARGFVQFYVRPGFYTIAASKGDATRTWSREAIGAPHARTAAEVAASAVPINWQYPEGHVLRYGANTTPGTTDMRDAIQAALNVIEESGGGKVQLPKGDYFISGPITLPAGCTLAGEGRETTIRITSTGSAIVADSVSNITLRDLQILGNGNPDSPNQVGVDWRGVTESLIHNVVCRNLGYDGIMLLSGCIGNVVSNCFVEDSGDDGINIGGNVEPYGSSTDNAVVGCVVRGVANDGIHISAGSQRTTAVGNVVYECGAGIRLLSGNDAVVVGNIIRDCTNDGFYVDQATPANRVAIVGNKIESCRNGISLRFAPGSTVLGNTIADCELRGIFLQGADVTDDAATIVFGNTITGGCSTAAIHITRVRGISVTGNAIKGVAASGIMLSSSSTNAVQQATIADNIVMDTTNSGISVSGGEYSRNVIIRGNNIVRAGTAGISYMGGPHFNISFNHIVDAGTQGINAAPSGSPRDGRGFLSGNTIDGGCTIRGITVGNYDHVIVRDNQVWEITASDGIIVSSGVVVCEGNLTDKNVTSTGGGRIGLLTSASPSGSSAGTITNAIEVFDKEGASVGFLPVYDSIT